MFLIFWALPLPSLAANKTFHFQNLEITSKVHDSNQIQEIAEETNEILQAHNAFFSDQGITISDITPLKIMLLSDQKEFETLRDQGGNRSESPRGYYTHSEHQIVSWEPLQNGVSSELRRILIHETLHHQLHSLFGHDLPLWLDEGLAVLFENSRPIAGMKLDPNVLHRAALSQVKAALRENQTVSLRELLSMDRNEFYLKENNQRTYSHSWSFVHFLINDQVQKNRNTFLEVLNALQNQQDPQETLITASGEDLSTLETKWLQYIQKL